MKVPANIVPAAAVIQWGRALFGMIWLKEFVGCLHRLIVKDFFLRKVRLLKPVDLSLIEESRITGVQVKLANPGRNIKGESNFLD